MRCCFIENFDEELFTEKKKKIKTKLMAHLFCNPKPKKNPQETQNYKVK